MMSTTESALETAFNALSALENAFYRLPGSSVVARYVRSSHQNDPGRTLLELILFAFVVRTLLQSRTRADKSGKHFIQFSEKEIDELVDEWTPESLAAPLDATEQRDLACIPVIAGANGPKPKLVSTGKTALNLASLNFAGLANNETIRSRAIETLRKYGVGSCGPPGFYGTMDVHMQLEEDIADFLGTEAAIVYSQDLSTVSSVIPAFCKRGDVIVADRGCGLAVQLGLRISRAQVRWYEHNDLHSLVEVLDGVERERRKRGGPLTRRFIVTEGIFERDGAMVDLPKLIEIKLKYKYRLILDESSSFGAVGRTGRGLTELYNVPASQVDMLIGALSTGLCASGGFCAGSRIVVDHQRINGTAFVFSASMPPLLAVAGSEAIAALRAAPSALAALQENVRTARTILDKIDGIHIPSHPASPLIHVQLPLPLPPAVPASPAPAFALPTFVSKSGKDKSHASKEKDKHHPSRAPEPTFDVAAEERALQDVADEALAQGVLLVRARRLRNTELGMVRPSLRLALTGAMGRKDVEKACGVIKSSVGRVLAKRR